VMIELSACNSFIYNAVVLRKYDGLLQTGNSTAKQESQTQVQEIGEVPGVLLARYCSRSA